MSRRSSVWPSFTSDRVWLSTDSVARRLDLVDADGVPKLKSVRDILRRAHVKPHYLGRSIRYRAEDIDQLLTERRQERRAS